MKLISLIQSVADQFENCVTIADMSLQVKGEVHPLIYVNKKFTEVTGYSYTESVGHNCKFLQGRLTAPDKVQYMRDMFLNESACCVDLVNYRKDAAPFWNRLVMFPLRDEGKLFYIGLQNDVTQIKKHQNTEKSLELVQHSEICHKINNPLTVVLGIQNILMTKQLSEEEKKILIDKIKSAISQVDNFVINLETVSEFENWKY